MFSVCYFVIGRARVPVLWRGVRWYQCMGGLLGALNVVSVILATASVGYALTSVAKMCASLCAASTRPPGITTLTKGAVRRRGGETPLCFTKEISQIRRIDHLGVFGFELKRCDRSAALSLAVVVFGAALSVLGGSNHRDANDQGSSTLAILIGLLLAVTSGTRASRRLFLLGGATEGKTPPTDFEKKHSRRKRFYVFSRRVQPLQAATNRALAETIGGVKIRATLVSFFGGAASRRPFASRF